MLCYLLLSWLFCLILGYPALSCVILFLVTFAFFLNGLGSNLNMFWNAMDMAMDTNIQIYINV